MSFSHLRPLSALMVLASLLPAQGLARREIAIPDVAGYRTLKCDLHMHTVFSDGSVWPTVRVKEAWRDGLDVIAITDHVENRPHKKDVKVDLTRPYDIAAPLARRYGLTILRGGEITRRMPPGHLNAICIKDENRLVTKKWTDAVAEANRQGGFVFWNHPGWTGQQKDGISRWYKEHTDLLSRKQMHGIEVVNGTSYYPRVHQWCLEKKLTMIANSDIHDPWHLDPARAAGHRSLTLVFAKDSSPESVRKALFARRTAIWCQEQLIGEEQWLKAIFQASLAVETGELVFDKRRRAWFRLRNSSDVPFLLVRSGKTPGFSLPRTVTVPARRTVLVKVSRAKDSKPATGHLRYAFQVSNLLVAPGKGLTGALSLPLAAESR